MRHAPPRPGGQPTLPNLKHTYTRARARAHNKHTRTHARTHARVCNSCTMVHNGMHTGLLPEVMLAGMLPVVAWGGSARYGDGGVSVTP